MVYMANLRNTRPSLQFLASQRRCRVMPELQARFYGFTVEQRGLHSQKAPRAGIIGDTESEGGFPTPAAQILVLKRKRRVTH